LPPPPPPPPPLSPSATKNYPYVIRINLEIFVYHYTYCIYVFRIKKQEPPKSTVVVTESYEKKKEVPADIIMPELAITEERLV
jgi:hypothetical protein